jgi:hypothetical protein
VLDMSTVPPRFQRIAAVGPAPAPRYGAAIVWDPVRKRVLLFGGRSLVAAVTETEVWELTLGDPPRWRRLAPMGTAPGPRLRHVAIYDPIRDRVVVYGGARRDGTLDYSLDDTWALSLSPELAWSKLTTAGVDPPALAKAAAVYDSRRDRMLVYGGGGNIDGRPPKYDLWALEFSATNAWSLVPTSGTPPMSPDYPGYGAAYDSTTDRLYVVPAPQAKSLPDTLSVVRLDLGGGNQWSPVATTGADPGRRWASSFGLLDRRLICIAGGATGGDRSDAHALDLDSNVWSDLEPIGAMPPAGWDAVMDSAGSRVFMIGDPPGTVSILRLDSLAVWQRPIPAGELPATSEMTLVWDSARGRMLAFDLATGPTAQVWSMTPTPRPTWMRLVPANAGPDVRKGSSFAYDAVRDRVLVFGGDSLNFSRGDFWELRLVSPPTWRQLPSGPLARGRAAMAIDPSGDRLVLSGGYTYSGCPKYNCPSSLTDMWIWPLTTDSSWTQVTPTGDIPWNQYINDSRPPLMVADRSRGRLLYTVNGSKYAWSLTLDPTPQWHLLQPGGLQGLIMLQPGVFDAARDRLLFAPGYYLGGIALLFGSPQPPGLICPAAGDFSPGSVRDVSFGLVDQAGLQLSYQYKLTCDRDWPGFPISGLASASSFTTDYVGVGIPVPDTAAFGAVQFGLSVSAVDQAGLDASCSFQLDGESVPVEVLGGLAQPDRVVVRWRTARPDLTITIARRDEAGPWVPLSNQWVASPGVVTYEDRSVLTDRRYYYRLETSDPLSQGEYGQIRVDVPRWSLGFSADQPNPIRGRFSVQCTVPTTGQTRLEAFDVTGRRVVNDTATPGTVGRVSFDLEAGRSIPSGVYFLRLSQAGEARRQTFVLLH